MAIYYIGSFPPAYGGVTVKNKNLYEYLEGSLDIRRIDMNRIKRGDVREMLRFVWAMLTGKQYVIGLAGQKNRRRFTKFMYRFKRKAMSRSVLVVMSGVVEDIIQAGPEFLKMMNTYRRVCLEFAGMVQKLNAAGVTNAAVYPNGRPRPAAFPPVRRKAHMLRCVFFSQIEPDKGVDRILAAAKMLPQVQFHFFGRIVPDYQDIFQSEMNRGNNVFYHGVFTGSTDAVYRELSQYDVLLLPTRCKTEGLPGVLVEAKIAGIPLIISGVNYIGEMAEDGIDGFVLPEDTTQCLCAAVECLEKDPEKLQNMKAASRASAERYYIDVCAQDILAGILEE